MILATLRCHDLMLTVVSSDTLVLPWTLGGRWERGGEHKNWEPQATEEADVHDA